MIRLAKLEDSVSINALSEHLGYASTAPDVAKERLNYLLASATDDIWLYEEVGNVLGWVHVFSAYRVASSAFYEIGGLVVDPDARNRGIGSQLLRHASEQISTNNMELRVRCHSKRLDAHRFYKKMGFTELKSQHVFKLHL